MSLEEVKKNELWRRLERNQAFIPNIDRIIRKMERHKDNPNYEIKDGKLVITMITEVCQRDSKTQCRKVKIYEFSIDNDNRLLLYKKKGTITTCRDEEYWTSNSGIIDNKYSCILFDRDGIVLSYQKYTDNKILRGNELNAYRENSIKLVDEAHDPHLPYSIAENRIVCCAPGVIGLNNKYVKLYRKEDALEVVHKIACSFKPDSTLPYFSHGLFFSTLSSDDRVNYNPDHISIGDDKKAFARVDSAGNVYINPTDMAMGITKENYMETARERYLDELIEDRDAISVAPDTSRVEEIFNILIAKLENEKDKNRGTM